MQCPQHPYSLLSPLGCPICEGEKLAELDRRAGRRFHRVSTKSVTPRAPQSVDEALQAPDIRTASAGNRTWLRGGAPGF